MQKNPKRNLGSKRRKKSVSMLISMFLPEQLSHKTVPSNEPGHKGKVTEEKKKRVVWFEVVLRLM
jgi:hypothetical protein